MTNTCASRAANRLVSSTRDTSTLEPIYNGVNDRVGQTVGLSTTNYALDVAAGLPEVIYTTEGNAYLHLPGLIMAESTEGEVRYLLSDGLGSVRQAVDESGALVAYHEFDPYGNPIDNGPLTTNYGFTGEWWEGDVGLLHLRARWYAPYTNDNPINGIDPSGYQSTPPGYVIVTCFGIAIIVPDIGPTELICTLVALGIISPVVLDPILENPAVEELIDEWADVANEAWKNWEPKPKPRPIDDPIPLPVPTPCPPDDDDNAHKVLTVGDGNFGYSNSLAALRPHWKITATNFGDGSNNQLYVGSSGNKVQYTNVDATRLETGRITGNDRYDAIIFNNPAVTTANNRVNGPQTARLISLFRRSAYRVLAPAGEIHINITQKVLQLSIPSPVKGH